MSAITPDPAAVAAAHDGLLEALLFYADPDTYFAIAILPDRPCGEFYEDFYEHGDPSYPDGDQRPGRRAKEAIEAWLAATGRTLDA